jgi:acetolactate synthase small subunit
MKLQRDDWVKTVAGNVGKVVHISKITVFVAFEVTGDEDRIDAFLESQLTKVERPERK